MFEIGRLYRITMLEEQGGHLAETTAIWTVEAVDGPCLTLSREGHPPTVVNTASPGFFRAELVEGDDGLRPEELNASNDG